MICFTSWQHLILNSIPLIRTVNIMDNMVMMLEKHATNLETLVAERTMQLLEEKKKTDMLLNQMLPE